MKIFKSLVIVFMIWFSVCVVVSFTSFCFVSVKTRLNGDQVKEDAKEKARLVSKQKVIDEKLLLNSFDDVPPPIVDALAAKKVVIELDDFLFKGNGNSFPANDMAKKSKLYVVSNGSTPEFVVTKVEAIPPVIYGRFTWFKYDVSLDRDNPAIINLVDGTNVLINAMYDNPTSLYVRKESNVTVNNDNGNEIISVKNIVGTTIKWNSGGNKCSWISTNTIESVMMKNGRRIPNKSIVMASGEGKIK